VVEVAEAHEVGERVWGVDGKLPAVAGGRGDQRVGRHGPLEVDVQLDLRVGHGEGFH
jgi:hypothetical protein